MIDEQELIARLRRIEGQARGIQRMVQEGRECHHILAQLTAMRKATQQVGLILARNYATQCLADALNGKPANIEDLVELINKASS